MRVIVRQDDILGSMLSRPRRNRYLASARAFALESALVGSLVALCGCASILGIDDVSTGGRDAATPDASTSDALSIDSGLDTSCTDGVILDGTGTTPIDTEAAGDDFTASCGGGGTADRMLVWTAPVTDYYVFDTFSSTFDTVLGLYAECAGEEFGCSNNVGDLGQSELVHKFEAGRQALILVDGANGDSGQGVLNIQRVTCPDSDLEGQVFPVELTTRGFGDDFSSACGGSGQEDRAYHWVAPQDGIYYFRVTAESFTPALTLLDGPRCDDRILGCGGAQVPAFGAEIVRFVYAGQPVSLVVDGVDGSGLFTLEIARKDDQSCSEAVLSDGSGPLQDDFTGRTLAPSCGFARQSDGIGGIYEVPDRVYTLTVHAAPEGCFGQCSVEVSAPQQVALYALEGDQCGGAEVGCQVAQLMGGTATASLEFPRAADDTRYTVVVADVNEIDGGGFTLSTVCDIACP
jgi:hypothetical protein